ncbi:uncharacterized protein PD653_3935 [Nocardioides sp. PD653]|nr:uncharacterized protein PD653B2_2089 [Nocardioides sp. PD653-B2]GAW56498.1 uncharacterized protein PD653_3935 [Nocardioides sp. PD653]
MVFAAVAVEVLPDLREDGHIVSVVIAFGAGVAFFLALGRFSEKLEARKTTAIIPIGLVVAVGIDLFVDGLLVGVGATVGLSKGIILTIALTLEILFLSLSVAAELQGRGASRRIAMAVPSGLGMLTAVGAIGGALALQDAGPTVLAPVLAFGAAALLYLVTEELLVEAHEVEETPLLASMFFLGFIVIFALSA